MYIVSVTQIHVDSLDASFHTRCPLDEAAQTDSHNRASLSILLDNESNVLTNRNPHSGVSTKFFAYYSLVDYSIPI